jgi:hypothetical protein
MLWTQAGRGTYFSDQKDIDPSSVADEVVVDKLNGEDSMVTNFYFKNSHPVFWGSSTLVGLPDIDKRLAASAQCSQHARPKEWR